MAEKSIEERVDIIVFDYELELRSTVCDALKYLNHDDGYIQTDGRNFYRIYCKNVSIAIYQNEFILLCKAAQKYRRHFKNAESKLMAFILGNADVNA